MKKNYRNFYEQVGRFYPEDAITYSSISGLLRRKWILQKMQSLKPGNLLDCGCNIGRLSASWYHGHIYGIDISYSVLQRGKKFFPKTFFIYADLHDLAFIKSDTIDNAIACEVVEHMTEPMLLFQQLYRIMKPGARLLVTVPGYTVKPTVLIPIGIMRSYGVKNGITGDRYLHTAYRPNELARLLINSGFQIIEQGSFERELRLWQKPINMIELIYTRIADHLFPSSKLNIMFNQAVERLKIDLYNALDMIGIIAVIKTIVRQGRRTYVLAEK